MFSEATNAAFRAAADNRCPKCGHGKLLRGLLTPEPSCPVCKTDFSQHQAGDGGPYVLILVLGHLMVAGALALENLFAPPLWVHVVFAVLVTTVASLALLPPVKRFLIAFSIMHDAGEDSRAGPRPAARAGEPAAREAAE